VADVNAAQNDPELLLEPGRIIEVPYSAKSWPIGAGMLQFPAITDSGEAMAQADPKTWRAVLSAVPHQGMRAIELSSRWIDLAALTTPRRRQLLNVVADLGLDVVGYLVAGRPVGDTREGPANLELTHRSIDAAADAGIGIVCVGLHQFSPAQPDGRLWFWTVQDAQYHEDPAVWERSVRAIAELGDHALRAGVQISVETYPGTPVGTSFLAAKFMDEVGHAAVGLNPDLGNLIRVQGPVEDWRITAANLLPRANYWHVKNYARLENPSTGTVLTHPASLVEGVLDYRKALRFALANGFSGPIVVEHYGGDGLSVSAANARYLRGLLDWMIPRPQAE
jgi:sugar phosphate isomerase/epimerase